MATIITSKLPWTRRPAGMMELSLAAQQAQGLRGYWSVEFGGKYLRNLVDNSVSTWQGSTLPIVTQSDNWGNVISLGGSSADYYESTNIYGTSTSGGTWMCWAYVMSGNGAYLKVGSNLNGYGIGIGSTTLDAANANGTDLITIREGLGWADSNSATSTGWHHITLRKGITSLDMFVDGTSVYSITGSPATHTAASSRLRLGGYDATPDSGDVRVPPGYAAEWRLYDRLLSPDEIMSHVRPQTRWEAIAPQVQRHYFDLGGGSVPSTPGDGAATILIM